MNLFLSLVKWSAMSIKFPSRTGQSTSIIWRVVKKDHLFYRAPPNAELLKQATSTNKYIRPQISTNDHRPPANDHKTPANNRKPPANICKPPASNHKPPTNNCKSPANDHKQPPSEYKLPRNDHKRPHLHIKLKSWYFVVSFFTQLLQGPLQF